VCVVWCGVCGARARRGRCAHPVRGKRTTARNRNLTVMCRCGEPWNGNVNKSTGTIKQQQPRVQYLTRRHSYQHVHNKQIHRVAEHETTKYNANGSATTSAFTNTANCSQNQRKCLIQRAASRPSRSQRAYQRISKYCSAAQNQSVHNKRHYNASATYQQHQHIIWGTWGTVCV